MKLLGPVGFVNSFVSGLQKPEFVLKRLILKSKGYALPRQLLIGVTYECQCRCVHCGVSAFKQVKKNQNELSTEEIKEIIRDAKTYQIARITFFGGEPLLREDIMELIEHTTSLNLESTLFTNGILLEESVIEELSRVGLTICNVSLDSPYAPSHDKLRGYPGCFEKAVSGIHKLLKTGIPCSIWTYVSKEDIRDNNLADLKMLIGMARTLGVDSIMILFPMASGNWLCKKGILLNEEEKAEVRKLYNPPFVRMEFPTKDVECRGGKRLIYIDPYGNVFPCPSLPFALGNIREECLGNILKRLRKERRCKEAYCMVNR